VWTASSASGNAIPAGEAVEVVAVEGLRLRVRPVAGVEETAAEY